MACTGWWCCGSLVDHLVVILSRFVYVVDNLKLGLLSTIVASGCIFSWCLVYMATNGNDGSMEMSSLTIGHVHCYSRFLH